MNGLVVSGLILAILFFILAVVMIVIFFINQSKGAPNPWWVYALMVTGIVIFIVGIGLLIGGLMQKPKITGVVYPPGIGAPVAAGGVGPGFVAPPPGFAAPPPGFVAPPPGFGAPPGFGGQGQQAGLLRA